MVLPALRAATECEVLRASSRSQQMGSNVARRSGWEDSDNQDGNPASRHWHDRRGVSVAQGAIEGLIVAARRSGVGRDCRVGRRAATASLAFECGAAAVALDVHLEDGGMM